MNGTEPRRGIAYMLLGVVAGLAIALVAAIAFGILIATSPAFGLVVTVGAVVAAIVLQIRRWSRATDFQRGILLGLIIAALIAGACFGILLNLKIR